MTSLTLIMPPLPHSVPRPLALSRPHVVLRRPHVLLHIHLVLRHPHTHLVPVPSLTIMTPLSLLLIPSLPHICVLPYFRLPVSGFPYMNSPSLPPGRLLIRWSKSIH